MPLPSYRSAAFLPTINPSSITTSRRKASEPARKDSTPLKIDQIYSKEITIQELLRVSRMKCIMLAKVKRAMDLLLPKRKEPGSN